MKTKPDLAVAIQTEFDTFGGDYGHLKAFAVILDSQAADGWRGVDSLPDGVDRLRCWHQTDRDHAKENRSYAWSIRYLPDSQLELYQAEKAVKSLRKVNKAMDKMNNAEGWVEHYGAFVSRFMRAIGAAKLVDLAKVGENGPNIWAMKDVPWIVGKREQELFDKLAGREVAA